MKQKSASLRACMRLNNVKIGFNNHDFTDRTLNIRLIGNETARKINETFINDPRLLYM